MPTIVSSALLDPSAYMAAFRYANDGIVLADPSGTTVEVNSAFVRLTGFDRPKLHATGDIAALVVKPGLADHIEEIARSEAGSWWGEIEIRTAVGLVLPVDLQVHALTDSSGRSLGYLRVYKDLRERKFAEEELSQSQYITNQLAVALPDILHIFDVKQLRNVYVNERVIELLDRTPGEIYALDRSFIAKLVHPDDQATITKHYAQFRQETSVGMRECEYRLATRNGAYRWIASRDIAFQWDEDGTPRQIIGVARDVTDRKELEKQSLQTQRLEAVGRLAGGIAHDFNNLLTVINGYGDQLLERLPDSDPTRAVVQEIRKAGETANTLTRQLLAFSRNQLLQPTVFDMNELVTNLENIVGRLLEADIDRRHRLASKPMPVLADRGQIELVLINLIINARDAMPKGGKLMIETTEVVLDRLHWVRNAEALLGPHVRLSIRDSGHGMDETTLARIFEPFFTTKPPGKGTGLGLATVYGIVRQSDGHIVVESEPGRGTVFHVFLPKSDLPLPLPPTPVPPPRSGGNEHLLLVEDNDAVRRLTRQILERKGYRVSEAANGPEALKLAEGDPEPIHLLVTDLVMPRMSGRELAEKLTVARPGLRVLYLSGYTDDALIRKGVTARDVTFLQKPFSPDTLARQVRAVLEAPDPDRVL